MKDIYGFSSLTAEWCTDLHFEGVTDILSSIGKWSNVIVQSTGFYEQDDMTEINAKFFQGKKEELGAEQLISGLLQYTDSLFSTLPKEFDQPVIAELRAFQEKVAAVTPRSDDPAVLLLVEGYIDLLEKVEIAFEQRKFEHEQTQEEETTEKYLDLLKTHPEQIPAAGFGRLDKAGSLLSRCIHCNKKPFLHGFYRGLSYIEVCVLGIAIARTGLILLGNVEGQMARYVLLLLGALGLAVFVTKMTQYFRFVCTVGVCALIGGVRFYSV